ncbi:MAG: nuclear transport factor 2 family protein [Desulfobacteraceae bacterium]|jgi:hypothetical protein
MDTGKSKSKPDNHPGHPDKARRSFMWKAGAGLSALLAASVPGIAGAAINNDKKLKADITSLSEQVGILEDEKEIRRLYKTYEDLLDQGKYEEITGLFTDDSEVIFNDNIFKGRKNGVNQLYCNHFRSGLTGKKLNSIQGSLPDTEEHQDTVEVTPDRKSARARFTYSIQVGAPIVSDSSLAEMARLQGEGIMKWQEGGTCDISFIKSLKDGTWKIKKLEYQKLS